MRVKIELTTVGDIERFVHQICTVEEDVRLKGKDENGNDWEMSAKSLLCVLLLTAKMNRERKCSPNNVDWNTIWCECTRDIYQLISDYVVE